jgi:hypothetical protein
MNKRAVWGILWACIVAGIVGAQSPSLLVAVVNGQLYRLNATLEPYSACQPPEAILAEPIVTPDNALLLLTMPAQVAALIEQEGGIGGGELPRNLWYCDMNSERLYPLSLLRDDFNLANAYSIISQPAVLQTTGLVGWVRLENDDVPYLAVYDPATQTVREYFMQNYQLSYGVPVSPRVLATAGAFLVQSDVYNFNTSSLEVRLYAYSPHDGLFLGYVLLETLYEGNDFITEIVALSDVSEGWIAYHLFDGGWRAAHALVADVGGVPLEGVEVWAQGDATNALFWSVRDGYLNDYATLNTVDAFGRPTTFLGYRKGQIALSGDGAQIAFWRDESALSLWDSNEYGTVANTQLGASDTASMAWGALFYRVPPFALGGVPTCPQSLPALFTAGSTATLRPDLGANNVRSAPSRSAARLGAIAPNERAQMLVGPLCSEGFTWYYLRSTSGLEGWSVQGDGREYYWR